MSSSVTELEKYHKVVLDFPKGSEYARITTNGFDKEKYDIVTAIFV